MNNNRLASLILILLFIFTLVLGVLSFMAPPALFPDPSWGFLTMRSMEMGGAFNHLVTPDQANIAKNTSVFLTWWSPGQYMLPYAFKTLFHTNTGQAAALTTTFCELLGLAGLFMFFRKVGFSPIIAAVSVAFIACQQGYYVPYIFYNGGELLQFAFVGWFLYGCFYFRKISIPLLVFILLAGWVGFFCKSAMMWIYASGLMCIWINISKANKPGWVWIKNGVWLAAPFVLSVACIYIFFLSKGSNPASAQHQSWRIIGETFTFPLASPLLSGFSVDDLAKGLVYHPDGPMFSHGLTIAILFLLAVVSVAIIIAIMRRVPYNDYKLAVAVFYGISVLFFSYAFFRQMAISYEGRHFRAVGLIVIPGVVYLVSRGQWWYKALFGAAWVFIAYNSFSRLYNEYTYNAGEGHITGNSGFVQQFIDKPNLDYLMQADRQHRNAIFVFTSVDLGLEIIHNRVVTLQPLGPDIGVDYEDYLHKGHAGPLYILLPSDYEENQRARFIMKCFPGYHNFKVKHLSEDYTIFEAE